jgi:hypothetical protein
MAVNYLLQFGSGDPRTFTGLAATFLVFKDVSGTNVTPPGITEVPSSTGLYYFSWGTTTSIFFLADAATTSPGSAGRYVAGNLDPLDRLSEVGATLIALGSSGVALGTTAVALGTTAVALGNTQIALETNQGTTLVAVGNSSIALGTSLYSLEQAIASTLLAVSGIGSSIFTAIGSTASSIGDLSTNPSDLFGYLKRIAELEQGQETFVKGSGVLTMLDRTGATTLAQRTVTNSASMVMKS